MKKQERKATVVRLRSDVNKILDIATEQLRKGGYGKSKNELINEILEKNIYNTNVKILNYEGESSSFLDIKEINDYVQSYICQYKYKLKIKFQKDNHIDDRGNLNISGLLCIPGIVESGEDGYYVDSSKLKYALQMDINEIDMADKLRDTVLNSLITDICKYKKENNKFIRLDDNEITQHKYYKFEEFKLPKDELAKIAKIEIVKYMKCEDGMIYDISVYIEDKNGSTLEDSYITDVNCVNEEEVLNYLSSCFGFDLRKFEAIMNIEDHIED